MFVFVHKDGGIMAASAGFQHRAFSGRCGRKSVLVGISALVFGVTPGRARILDLIVRICFPPGWGKALTGIFRQMKQALKVLSRVLGLY